MNSTRFFLADAFGNGAGYVQQAQQVSSDVAKGWDKMWDTVITPGGIIYPQLCLLGELFAICTLLLWMVHFTKRLLDNEHSLHPFSEIIFPVFVAILLANRGAILASLIHDIRGVIVTTDNQLLKNTALQIDLKTSIVQSQHYAAVSDQIAALLQRCQALVGQEQTNCLQNAQQQANQLFAAYPGEVWVSQFQNWLTQAFAAAQGATAALSPTSPGIQQQLFNLAAGAALRGTIGASSMAFEWMFQNLLEVSLMLTGLLAPLAVGGALLPVGVSPIWAWLTGMFSLGMAKISYDLMVGLTGEVILETRPTDSMGFELFLGIGAPFLALFLAAGGGFAVWTGITRFAQWGGQQALGVAAGAARVAGTAIVALF